MTDPNPLRRTLLKGAGAASIFPLATALAALQQRTAAASDGSVVAGTASTRIASPYGPIAPVNDRATGLPLLQLPAGFSYTSAAWRGDRMSNGQPCPGNHDGMAVVTSRDDGRELVLIRNHELGASAARTFFGASAIYDTGKTGATYAAGGCVNLIYRDGVCVDIAPGLAGTLLNCAGGATPWGSWLSCEEVSSDAISSTGKKHGYVFEVTPEPTADTATPIIGMGRFRHEAATVDPATGIVYLSEDDAGRSGFYRYLPTVRDRRAGALAQGGRLQMAKVKGANNIDLASATLHQEYRLEWVDIAEPDQDRGDSSGANGMRLRNVSGPFAQGWRQGALRMNRGEGMWHFAGKLYVMDTAGGAVDLGALWELDLTTQTLRCIHVSAGVVVDNMGDNVCVSPRGGIVICEDALTPAEDEFGSGQRLLGLDSTGASFIFAKNNVQLSAQQLSAAGKSISGVGDHRGAEFAGACFSPDGQTLFVNIYTPGFTVAITGPWQKGPF